MRSAPRPRPAVVQRRPDASPCTTTAFIAPSTFASRRFSGISVGCTRSSMRFGAARDAEQLDPVAEFFRVADVGRVELADALDVRALELHRHAERDRAHDRRLVCGVDAFDVEGRIGFRVAEPCAAFSAVAKSVSAIAHFRQDVVGRAVDDARDVLDAVRGQAFAQRLDDRDAAGDGRLERDHHALRARGSKISVPCTASSAFVGRHDVLVARDRAQHELARDAVPPIISAMIAIDGSSTTELKSSVICAAPASPPSAASALAGLRTAMRVTSIPRPARRLISSWLRPSTVKCAAHRAEAQQANFDRFHAACDRMSK